MTASTQSAHLRNAACLALLIFVQACLPTTGANSTGAVATARVDTLDLSTRQGMQEMVVSVKFLDEAIETYQNFADYELLHRGLAPRQQASHWGLDQDVGIEQAVLRAPGLDVGLLRLVKFHDVEQVRIRSGARPFDRGGIFNLNMRAKNLEEAYQEVLDLGFVGFSDPNYYKFGEGQYGGAMVRGHDGVVINLLTRVNGDYSNVRPFGRVSHIINSTQMVGDFADLDRNIDFLEQKLGWVKVFDASPEWPKDGSNNMSLPNSLVLEGNIRQRAAGFKFSNDADGGSIELFSFDGISGIDFSGRAHPPNLGVLMYRIHVPDIHAYERALAKNEVAIERPMSTFDLPPYGTVKSFAVVAPTGAWIEFFQQAEADQSDL